MEWLLGAGAGAIAGALASVLTASRIARGSELGRVQEAARLKLLSTVRLFRAHVAMERGEAGFRSAMDVNYLSADSRQRFAEDVEADLAHLKPRLRDLVRKHVETLCGPVDARSAQLASPLSVVDQDPNFRAVYFLSQAMQLTQEQITDTGLLGKARDAQITGDGVPEVVAELDRLEDTLMSHERLRIRMPRKHR